MRTEIVRNDDIADPQRGYEDLIDVGQEARAIDRAVEDAGRGEPGDAQGGEESAGLPPPERGVVVDALPPGRATIPAEQGRGDAGLVEKDQVRRIPRRSVALPVRPRRRDVRSVVLAGPYGFF